jgi:hypothetical protein
MVGFGRSKPFKLMNYTTLLEIFPGYFKKIGYVLAIISMLVAVVYKIHTELFPEFLSLRIIQTIFFISLLFIISTKSKKEDERTTELRLAVSALGFYMLLGLLLFMEVFGYLVEFTFPHQSIFDMCLVYLFGAVILFEALNRTSIGDKLASIKEIFWFAFAIVFFLVLFLNKWFWAWNYSQN